MAKRNKPYAPEIDGEVSEDANVLSLQVAVPVCEAVAQPVMLSTSNDTTIEEFIPVGVFKVSGRAAVPEYATLGSSCFDLKACLVVGQTIKCYNRNNQETSKDPCMFSHSDQPGICLEPGDRALVPTGLIFDLPEDTTLKLYPRSGLSLKQGLDLGNCTGIVDADYVEPTFVILRNTSDTRVYVHHGERICQGEVIINPPKTRFELLNDRPGQKTNRSGGFGHTGRN